MKSRIAREALVQRSVLALCEAFGENDLRGIVIITKWADGMGLVSSRASGYRSQAEDDAQLKREALLTLADVIERETHS